MVPIVVGFFRNLSDSELGIPGHADIREIYAQKIAG
jgi:hypothetical protein